MRTGMLAALLGVVSLGAGCADFAGSHLEVVVSVYKGPLNFSPSTKLATAWGLTRAMRETAADAALFYEQEAKSPHAALTRLACLFDDEPKRRAEARAIAFRSLVVLFDQMVTDPSLVDQQTGDANALPSTANQIGSAGVHTRVSALLDPNDPNRGLLELWAPERFRPAGESTRPSATQPHGARTSSEPNERTRAHAILCASMLRFAESAEALAHGLAVDEASLWGVLGERELLRTCTSLEETGKIVRDIVDSINWAKNPSGADEDALVQLSALMANQSPGTLVTILENPWFVQPFVKNLYEKRYWDQINTIHVAGTGDVQYMLVKDEIGNWHLKRAAIDPSKIINAVSAGVTAAVNIASTAFGAPLKLTTPHVQEDLTTFDETLTDAVVNLGWTADDPQLTPVLQRLRRTIASVQNDPNLDAKKKEAALQSAIRVAVAEIP